jgi:hypothetical protein
MTCCCNHDSQNDSCAKIPQFERPTYHFGQLLGPDEFLAQHAYLADKLELVTRYGVGHGVACGLEVSVEVGSADPCTPSEDRERWWLCISPGIAVDCLGRVLVLRRPLRTRLQELLSSHEERERFRRGDALYVGLCFEHEAVGPARPMALDACDPCQPAPYARWRDLTCPTVRFEWPRATCDECCATCEEPCVLLARVEQVREDECDPYLAQVQNELRRLLGRAAYTRIAGISWTHAAPYPRDEANRLLGEGLRIRFSDEVQADAVSHPGVVDVTVYQGGAPPAGPFYLREIEVQPQRVTAGLTQEILISFPTGEDETLQRGDRVLITVRGDFVLDRCCRALDGNHLGGRVPRYVPDVDPPSCVEHPKPPDLSCRQPAERPAWSGNGTEGGTFESWFYVERRTVATGASS